MTPLLLLYLGLGAAAVIIAGIALSSMLQRRDVIQRATQDLSTGAISSVVLRPDKIREGRIRARLQEMAKEQQANAEIQSKLVQAGFDSPTAPGVFVLLRMVSFFAVPLIAFLAIPQSRFLLFAMSMTVAVFLGFLMPVALLDRFARLRQERIKRSVPDALDLLVVCVEAGISLDAGILRVAKELRLVHADLAHELMVVNRVTNAGIPRETALRGLWQRTGVVDIRTLVSSMIQSEKWGTSIATVLRVAAETLRRKRRQAAEKKAKMAALKMTFPLLLFILPALFVVILGPAVVQIMIEFGKV
jgi:tight adherence protein C